VVPQVPGEETASTQSALNSQLLRPVGRLRSRKSTLAAELERADASARLKVTQIEPYFDARPFFFEIRDMDWSKRARFGASAALAGQCRVLVLPVLKRLAQGDIARQFPLCRGRNLGIETLSYRKSCGAQTPVAA
jgi:hypothetical protein